MTTVNIGNEPRSLRLVVNVIEKKGQLLALLHGLDTQGVVPRDLIEEVMDDPNLDIDGAIDTPGTYLVEVLYEWNDGDSSVGIWPGWDLVEITSAEPLSLIHAHEGIYES